MLVKHSLQYAVARGVPAVASLLLLVIYTRILSPYDYGTFTAALSVVILIKATVFQWLELAVLRNLPSDEDPGGRRVTETALGVFALAAAAVVAVAATALLVRDAPGGLGFYAAAVAAVIGVAWFELQLAVMQKRMLPMRYGMLRTLRSVFETALGVGLVMAGLHATGPMLGLLLGVAIAAAIVPGLSLRGVRPRIDTAQARAFVAYGLPLSAAFAAASVMGASDRLMLASMQGASAAGVFSASSELAGYGIGVVMMIVNLAAYPLVLKAYESGGRVAAEVQLARNAHAMLAATLPAVLAVVVLAHDLAEVVLGAEFRAGASTLLPVLAVFTFISGFRSFVFDLAFQVTRKTSHQAAILFATAGLNIVLNYFLIDAYGALGAACASTVCAVLAMALSIRLGRPLLSVQVLNRDTFKVVAAAVLGFGWLPLLDDSRHLIDLILKGAAGGTAYLVAMYLLDAIGARERLRSSIARVRGQA